MSILHMLLFLIHEDSPLCDEKPNAGLNKLYKYVYISSM